MPGKTPMWGNPMREIYLLFSFRKVHITSNNTISSQEKNHLQHPTFPKIYASIFMPSLYICTTHLQNLNLEIHANSLLYGLFGTAQQQEKCSKQPRKIVPMLPLFSCPLPLVVQSVWICTVEFPKKIK
jgi:hypothetical protein